jgi:hypothetical protein
MEENIIKHESKKNPSLQTNVGGVPQNEEKKNQKNLGRLHV